MDSQVRNSQNSAWHMDAIPTSASIIGEDAGPDFRLNEATYLRKAEVVKMLEASGPPVCPL